MKSAGSLVAPAPKWFHGWIKNTRPAGQQNRPIAPNGRRGQPPGVAAAFSRDAVGIVIFGKISPCCVPPPHCRTLGQKPRGYWIAGRAGSKRHGFSFHGGASRASCRHASDRVLRERCARRGHEPTGVRATCGDTVAVSLRPERRCGAWRRRSSTARGRSASPAAGFHHQADAGAARPHARLQRHRRLDPAVRRQGRAAGRYRL